MKVDIIGISVDRKRENEKAVAYDSRAISVEEAMVLREYALNAKMAVLVNHYAADPIFTGAVLKELKPHFLNIYLPHGGRFWMSEWYSKYLSLVNNIPVPVIVFGDAIGYDTPFYFEVEEVQQVRNLMFTEINCYTLNRNLPHFIKSEKYWGIRQSQTSDLLYETVQDYFEGMNVLLDDRLDKNTLVEDIENSRAKGMTLSLRSLEKDLWTRNTDDDFLSIITKHTYEMEEVIDLVKIIKS